MIKKNNHKGHQEHKVKYFFVFLVSFVVIFGGRKKDAGDGGPSPAYLGGEGELGRGRRPLGVSGQGEVRGRERSCMLQFRTSEHRFAQFAASLQVAQQAFRQHVYRLGVLGPFQLPLARRHVLNHVFQPEQIGFALAHVPPSFDRGRISLRER